MRRRLIALLAGCAALAACHAEPGEQPGPTPHRRPAAASSSLPAPAPSGENPDRAGPSAGENDGHPDLTPAELTPEAARTVKGARAVLLSWARAIELREFGQAWRMMGDGARARLPKARLAAMFEPLRDLSVAMSEGSIEGAAGSSYYTVPATVTGARGDGGKATLTGTVVLRRVNDVPGATAEQLRWHIESVDLEPAG